MTKQVFLIFFIWAIQLESNAQFAPAQGQAGSTAIYKDSSIIVAWATACTVRRGLMDISQDSLGLATAGEASLALGAAGDALTVSLGDSGIATLTFDYPIGNGSGPDFAVFENSFSATFLELAFVEVSSDGQNFVRFPAISNTDTTVQVGSFGGVDASQIHNLAGKYRAGYGTPFDLSDLIGDSLLLDVNRVTHVRLVDAIGSMQNAYASRDSRGVKVNDPWNTPFASGGFDLDAIGVIHSNTNIAVKFIPISTVEIYPNPVHAGQDIFIEGADEFENYAVGLYNLVGQLLLWVDHAPSAITSRGLNAGCYIIKLQGEQKSVVQRIIIQ